MEPVLGHRNQRVVAAARLHRARERRKLGQTIIEGPNLLREAIDGGAQIELVFALAEDVETSELASAHRLDLVRVDHSALARVAGTKSPRGPVAVIRVPPSPGIGAPGLLVAWSVGDPGNVGTLVRIAAAFGWGFGYAGHTADPWSPKVLRAGAGAHFRIRMGPISGMPQLEGAGYTTAAAVVAGGLAPDKLPIGRYALLIGEEALGLSEDVVSSASVRVTIPMPGGTESVNAAIAAGIIVYELAKPERQGGGQV